MALKKSVSLRPKAVMLTPMHVEAHCRSTHAVTERNMPPPSNQRRQIKLRVSNRGCACRPQYQPRFVD